MANPRALVERAGFTNYAPDGTIFIPVYITYIDPDSISIETKQLELVTSTNETALVMNRALTDLATRNAPAGQALAASDVVLLLHISKGS